MEKEKGKLLLVFMVAIVLMIIGGINFVLLDPASLLGNINPIHGLEWLLVVGGALPILYDIWHRKKTGKKQVWQKKSSEVEDKCEKKQEP